MGSTQTSLHWIWDTVTFHIFMKCYYYYDGFNDSDSETRYLLGRSWVHKKHICSFVRQFKAYSTGTGSQ